MQCPHNALFCGGGMRSSLKRCGQVEGKEVCDILLHTGCSRTMVHQDLVQEEKKLEGEAVAIRCTHGDMTLYPLAEIDMELEGLKMKVTAAVSDRLPVSVLLGTDTPELSMLLRFDLTTTHTTAVEEALVMTRAQLRAQEEEEKDTAAAEELSGAVPSPICRSEEDYQTDDSQSDEEVCGSNFDSDLFISSTDPKTRLTEARRRTSIWARESQGSARKRD